MRRIVNRIFVMVTAVLFLPVAVMGQDKGCCAAMKTPVMGWSSWNTYRVNISDSLIKVQADAMVGLGLNDAGYRYVNIDDGFFGGRDRSTGELLINRKRFPEGLRPVVDHIHSLGLKAGIYSDAGSNTCGNFYDNDTLSVGVGFYGYDQHDADFYFKECGFDFIKIDFCGGDEIRNFDHLDLDESQRYAAIREAIDRTGCGDVRINVCRWDYPGTWVGTVGDSWRISHDISADWNSVKDIIRQNLYLSAYCGGGHYNDMDMLEVGRGMTAEEDRTHFGLWCVMSSPLLIGCDLNSIDEATLSLLKNRELIGVNQDRLGLQAYVAENDNGVYLLVKDVKKKYGTERVVAIYNSTNEARNFDLRFEDVDLGGAVGVRDLFELEEVGVFDGGMKVDVGAHATKIYKLDAERRLRRTVYEAETAYLSRYQELEDHIAAQTAIYEENDSCRGGVCVSYLGMRPDNDLQWRNVYVEEPGEYDCRIVLKGNESCQMTINVNGEDVGTIAAGECVGLPVELRKGENCIRVYTTEPRWMPSVDYMTIDRLSRP